METLTENDKVSIVTYAGSSEIVLDSVSGDNKAEILDAIYNLTAEGSTRRGGPASGPPYATGGEKLQEKRQ